MDTAGPTSRLERQHARARRSAPTPLERAYVPPSTDQILAIARPQRRTRNQRATAMTTRERDAAYEALPAPAAALYRQLGACSISWFDTDMLAVLIDLDAPAAERLTRHLLERGLLLRAGYGFALGPHG